MAHNLIVKAFAFFANDADNFQHGVFVAAAQTRSCANATTFGQTAHDLDYFGFVQSQSV
jgi:hypothetical protein